MSVQKVLEISIEYYTINYNKKIILNKNKQNLLVQTKNLRILALKIIEIVKEYIINGNNKMIMNKNK